jgi:hypothetical protein
MHSAARTVRRTFRQASFCGSDKRNGRMEGRSHAGAAAIRGYSADEGLLLNLQSVSQARICDTPGQSRNFTRRVTWMSEMNTTPECSL